MNDIWLKRVVIGVIAVFASLSSLLAQTNVPPRTNIELSRNANGEILVSIDHQPAISIAAFKSDTALSKSTGLNLSLTANGQSLQISAQDKEVIVEAAGFAGWAMRVPMRNRVDLRPDFTRVILDFSAPLENSDALVFRFGDGGKASMAAGSSARFDLFKDQSYYFSALGKVDAINADGQAMKLGPYRAPLTGGPLVKKKDASGLEHLERLSPIRHVYVSGDMTEKVDVKSDGTTVSLKADDKRNMTADNGGQLNLLFNKGKHAFGWQIEKGYFVFHVANVRCWSAAGLTDQAASQQWDQQTKSIDLSNQTPSGTVPPNQVLLSSVGANLNAGVNPAALFQYAQVKECDTFASSANGGRVVLYNLTTGQSFELQQNNLLFSSGRPGGGVLAGNSKTIVALNWSQDGPVDIRSNNGAQTIKPGTDKLLIFGDTGSLDVNYGSQGSVILTGKSGNYAVEPKPIPGWSFDIPEGASVAFTMNYGLGVFSVHADAGNTAPIVSNSSQGFSPVLSPDSTLTFIIGSGNPVLASSQGTIIFYESAGATQDGFAIGNPISPPNSTIDPSQITQPPVSGFNGN